MAIQAEIGMKQKVTLEDISKKTGFSQSTVSMILTRRTDVSFSANTIQIVEEAAKELGYLPVTRKKIALFTRRTIMIVCPFVINHYYSTIIQAFQSAAAQMRCNVLVYTTYNDPDEEKHILKVMAETDIGGIVFATVPNSLATLKKISARVPIIVLADDTDALGVEIVKLNNYQAGCLIAEHLARLGHKHLICISSPLSASVGVRIHRYKGLEESWRKLCPEGSIRLFTNFVSSSQIRDNIQIERMLGRQIMESVLENEPDSFTAIVAVNDMFAYGIMDALSAAGLSVPEKYSLCGMDNDFPSGLCGVNLTSIEHFMAQNVHIAFRRLYRKIAADEPSIDISAKKVISPELIVRRTTAVCTRP